MEDIRKVNSMQLYLLWRNFAIGLLCMAATLAGTHMLPFYMAPVVSLVICGVLFSMVINNQTSEHQGCTLVLLTIIYSLLGYTFTSIILVVFHMWGVDVRHELVFFNEPYMPSLILLPILFAVSLFVLIFKNSLPLCRQCQHKGVMSRERSQFGYITDHETTLQLRNLTLLFGILSVVIWWYYLKVYVDVNQNGRDWYVFVWIVILGVLLDELYFMMRYYNLYLDLQEHNEIVTPDELRDMAAKTYLRYYVICGEYMYVDRNSFDRLNQVGGKLDTPFVSQRTVNGIPMSEVKNIIEKMTRQKGGELRFYFGRHLPGIDKHSLLRYFYFLDGSVADYADMGMPGEWVHFDEIKKIYSDHPLRIASTALNDISRMLTIILTERIYDEEGQRKNKITSYRQNLTLTDVRNTQLDLQDDKWVHISMFNSDTRFFRFKRWWRGISGRRVKDSGNY